MVYSSKKSKKSSQQDMYSGGVASLIGVTSGISLDGQSVQLPETATYDGQSVQQFPNETTGYDIQDDISSIYESSYYRGASNQMKIVGAASSMEEGTVDPKTMGGMGAEDPEPVYVPKGSHRTPTKIQISGTPSLAEGTANGESKKGVFPQWVNAAPQWLKVVILFSIALLVGAAVLVTVALVSALNDDGNDGSSNATASEEFSSKSPPVVVTIPTTTASSNPIPAPAPSEATPSTSAPTFVGDFLGHTDNAGLLPQESDAMQITDPAAVPYDELVTTFFVTAGRFTNDALTQLPEQLRTLPVRGGTSFLVHLGDWNSPYATQCDAQSYQDVNDLYSNSSIPVYFVTGDNEFNDCPDPKNAMSQWYASLLDYETQHWNVPQAWNVTRDEDYPENFAFSYNDILFIGINLVGGSVHDTKEWEKRQEANLQWIDQKFQLHRDSIKAFVLFAHADPDVPSNSPFYEPFKSRVAADYNQVPVVLINRNLGVEPWSWETEFENISNFSVIVVEGSVWPPLMGAVDFRLENPFVFDQALTNSWYDEYLEHQFGNERA